MHYVLHSTCTTKCNELFTLLFAKLCAHGTRTHSRLSLSLCTSSYMAMIFAMVHPQEFAFASGAHKKQYTNTTMANQRLFVWIRAAKYVRVMVFTTQHLQNRTVAGGSAERAATSRTRKRRCNRSARVRSRTLRPSLAWPRSRSGHEMAHAFVCALRSRARASIFGWSHRTATQCVCMCNSSVSM